MEPEGSLPHSQVPATGPYPEPARSNPHPHTLLPEDPSTKSHVLFPLLTSYQSISPGSRLCLWIFRNIISFYGEELLAPRPTPKLKDHPLSVVRVCLFNIFAAALHIGGRSSIRNLKKRHAVVTGTHWSRVKRVSGLKNFELSILRNIKEYTRAQRPLKHTLSIVEETRWKSLREETVQHRDHYWSAAGNLSMPKLVESVSAVRHEARAHSSNIRRQMAT
jgi:hypothetical protein